MNTLDRSPRVRRSLAAPIALIAALCLGLFFTSLASAAFEQVGTFAGTPGAPHSGNSEWPEEVQLGGVGGMAVNETGAGGVPAGTIYAAVGFTFNQDVTVARYNPDGSFSEAWTFNGSPAPERRCGPEGEAAHPTCLAKPAAIQGNVDVDVDQSTGYVYIYDGTSTYSAGTNRIHVYTPDGTEVIAEFGEQAPSGETILASPGKLHATSNQVAGIALDIAGDVYVFDAENSGQIYHRLAEFEPQSAGDYAHYVYAGQGHDVWAGSLHDPSAPPFVGNPIFDAAGNLYGTNARHVYELDPSQPSAPATCQYEFPQGGIEAMTVDPQTGEVFFFSEKDTRIHQLSACSEGKFTEVGSVRPSPGRSYIGALVVNPTLRPGPGRPVGTLYAASPSGEGGKTEPGKGESSLGYVFGHPLALAPAVLSESFSHVTATTAQLGAQIDPEGSVTRFAFQYETEAAYQANAPSERFLGATETPPGGALLGEGKEAISAAASLVSLTPDTAYRFRVVATSHCSTEEPEKVCEGTGETQSLRTFAEEAPGLPDHRAWELVSPVQKQGGQVFPAEPRLSSCGEAECKPGVLSQHFPMQSAPDGNSVVYEGSAFDSEQSSLLEDEYVARRNPQTGWQTANLTPTQLSTREHGFKAFDAPLTMGVLNQGKEQPTFSSEAPLGFENLYAQPSADPASLQPLLTFEPPDRSANTFALSYVGASADLSRIFFEANDALTGATEFAPEAVDGGQGKSNLYEWHEGQLSLVNVLPGNAETEPGAVFGSGRRLKEPGISGGKVITNAVSTNGARVFWSGESGQVYLREDGKRTKEIETEGTPDPAPFLSASPDGAKVLLADGHLHYLEGGEQTTDLTEGKGGFEGIAGQSDDLSRIYFVDTEVLTGEEENEQHAKAVEGKDNLYARAEGEGTRFVATLLPGDNDIAHGGDWGPSPTVRTAEASPHGRYLAFLSKAVLSGYDNTGPCESDRKGGYISAPCEEVFLYDSATGKLSCPSCNRSGQSPLGPSFLRIIDNASGTEQPPQPRYLSDEGRLYFDSGDALVPADSNGRVEDVYEYEPGEVGTCGREGGCVSLISAGTGVADSNFLAMDESGKDVFFTSRDQLTLKDKDQLIDLYDAREFGGIPAETEVARSECQGEACQPAIAPPNDPTPGSSTFEGAGNVHEEAKAKKHAKKHKKKRHAKKHSKKRAAKRNRGGAK